MGTIEKGVVLTLEGELDRNDNYTMAKVQALTAEGTSTLPITIPWYLRGSMGKLEKGTEIIFAMFEDETGIIVSRMDGNWEGRIEEKTFLLDTLGGSSKIMGSVEVSEKLVGTEIVSNDVVLATHQHKTVVGGSENTDKPNGGR